MRCFSYSIAILLWSASSSFSGPPAAGQDIWETVFARDRQGNDQQIGYSHLKFEPAIQNGKKTVRVTRELSIKFKRDGQLAELKAETGTEETEEGKVVAVFMKQWIGKEQALSWRGEVDKTGTKLQIKVEAATKREFETPWEAKVLGQSAESTLFRDRKIESGNRFSYQFYEPTLSSVVTVDVKVKDEKEILLPRGGKKKLLGVESTPEKIQNVQMPASNFWVDPQTREIVMTQTEMPSIGMLTLLRSSKEAATGPLGDVPDLMKMQTIRLLRTIPEQEDIHRLGSVTFKMTVSGDADPAKLLKMDDRQRIENLKGKSFELVVEARRSPKKLAKEAEAGAEFIKSNHFINSDDENVKKLAVKAVGTITDPWEKAKAIERWVRANMKAENYTEAMATSDHVAKTLSGDCTEYAMLTAAMCKAQGIPARTALGLIYVPEKSAQQTIGTLAFHMWTEVYIKGQWLGLDATLGRGSIGPGHIKITDHSWYDVEDFKPLLPVTGFLLAKPVIEIKTATRE
jgi:Transglutaminase-like superfamily